MSITDKSKITKLLLNGQLLLTEVIDVVGRNAFLGRKTVFPRIVVLNIILQLPKRMTTREVVGESVHELRLARDEVISPFIC